MTDDSSKCGKPRKHIFKTNALKTTKSERRNLKTKKTSPPLPSSQNASQTPVAELKREMNRVLGGFSLHCRALLILRGRSKRSILPLAQICRARLTRLPLTTGLLTSRKPKQKEKQLRGRSVEQCREVSDKNKKESTILTSMHLTRKQNRLFERCSKLGN